ncbi:MAG: hypothetical protein K1X94_04475 [Sandaracinaceae bacterium]|nr:hypothetical protein [Sandaracinaceae bacterium]
MLWTARAAALALVLAASSAAAQSPSHAESEALAEAQRGLVARREGRDEEARQAFERSLSLAPRASVRAQLGFALQALGRWVEAESTLVAAAALDDPWIERHRDTLDGALAEVRAHLGTLTLTVVPGDATLRIDGVPTPADVASRLPVGSVTLSAEREGYYGTERIVVIHAGDVLRESFELRARPAERVPVVDTTSHVPDPDSEPAREEAVAESLLAPAPPELETRHWGGPAVALGVGASSLGAGFALLAARDTALGDLLSRGCVETPTEYVCDSGANTSAAEDAHTRAETFAAASTATLALGGTLVALGVGWLLVEWLRPPSSHEDASGLRVTPGGVQWTF